MEGYSWCVTKAKWSSYADDLVRYRNQLAPSCKAQQTAARRKESPFPFVEDRERSHLPLWWPLYCLTVSPDAISQRRAVWSDDAIGVM